MQSDASGPELKPLDAFTSRVVYGSTFCKRPIDLQILIRNDTVEDVGGAVECPYSRQWLAALIQAAKGKDLDAAWSISGDDLRAGITPPEQSGDCVDCDTYVVAAFRLALRKFEKGL
ncbi:hypothetical protein [Fundidesulfovibrio magnetotacticus]|nr:hypothetical protein [Fundidesulfovibrio magnetotacticus]